MSRALYLMLVLSLCAGCGRYFPGPIHPVPEGQQPHMIVKDDGTIIYAYERLEISLRPMSDEELNRSLALYSQNGAESTNPYTYGNWKPMGEDWTPQRFTVFLVKVKNYRYPKVQVDPYEAELTSESGRAYRSLTLLQLSEYYRSYAVSWAGNPYERFEESKDLLKQTLYRGDVIFSGQEDEGYIMFPRLDRDVTRFQVVLRDIALRFDYRNEPTDTLQLTFQFQRDVHKGYHPPRL